MPEALQRLSELLASSPLYAKSSWSGIEALALVDGLRLRGITLDAYCVYCQKPSTFGRPAFAASTGSVGHLTPEIAKQTLADLRRFDTSCARASYHVATFCLNSEIETQRQSSGVAPGIVVSQITIQKMGQFPALADLESARFREYQGLIDDADLAELRRAAGLASHGIGIGSFVYLRRIFERLVERGHATARNAAGWNEDAYQRARMDERIALLRTELPQFVVENRRLYGILSQGIHELSEEQCQKHYKVVELAIVLTLDEIRNAQERQRRITEAQRSLAQLHEQLQEAETANSETRSK